MSILREGHDRASAWSVKKNGNREAFTGTTALPPLLGHLSILLALDGVAPSNGAVALARWLTESRGAHTRVLSVVEPGRSQGRQEPPRAEHAMAARCAARREIIRDQIADADPYDAPWGTSVVPGAPVSVLAEAASGGDVDLLVVGMPANRCSGGYRDDTAMRVMRRSATPVVAVADGIRVPPRQCVVAVDFTRSSLHAARAALAVLASDGTLTLAHVQPELAPGDTALHGAYVKAVAAAFARVQRDLKAPSGVRVEHVLLDGHPRAALASLCDRVGADLLAMGTLPLDVARLHRGRLSTSFLRAGTRSLLVAPPA